MTNAIPDGYHSITPYLIVDDAAKAIDFYTQAFGAEELFRLKMPVPGGAEGGDRIGHAEIRVGDSIVMLADEFPALGHLGPNSRGGPTASLLHYTADVDEAFKRAVAAGCIPERPPEDQFWGDRMGSVRDPFGHQWSLATHVEDVSPEEMQRRMVAFTDDQVKAEITIKPELAE